MNEPTHVLDSICTLVGAEPALKWVLAAGGALVSYFLPNDALKNLAVTAVTFVVCDTVTGVMAARSDGQAVSSARFGRLLTKLTGYSIAVILATMGLRVIPGVAELAPGGSGAVLTMVVVTEAISIIENLDRMGIKLPKFLKNAFQTQEKPE